MEKVIRMVRERTGKVESDRVREKVKGGMRIKLS